MRGVYWQELGSDTYPCDLTIREGDTYMTYRLDVVGEAPLWRGRPTALIRWTAIGRRKAV